MRGNDYDWFQEEGNFFVSSLPESRLDDENYHFRLILKLHHFWARPGVRPAKLAKSRVNDLTRAKFVYSQSLETFDSKFPLFEDLRIQLISLRRSKLYFEYEILRKPPVHVFKCPQAKGS